ncbi:MAG TPA: FAD-dependent oxidoreductase [Naasia sp.]|jgi:glycine/D-amino acid oxidase-like deaminating enzyme/nitrite reductase/ring-hydroxylating ferredoxin subunit
MTSLWLDRPHREEGTTYPASDFGPGASYEVLVVGAGLTGLVTALLLTRAGKRVAVVDQLQAGGLTTGKSTAKLTLLQGARLRELLRHTAPKNARAYVEANREGFEWLVRYLDDHGVPYQRRDAFSYAGTPDGAALVDEEVFAGLRLGLPVEKVRDLDLPFPTFGAVRLRDQAQFDPMDVVRALAGDFRARGGTLAEGVRVTRVRTLANGRSGPCRVVTSAGEVDADRVVLATGMPILDRGLYFAKLVPSRSYALAFRTPPGALDPDFGMYISVDSPTRTLRSTPGEDGEGDVLVVGGNGHVTGRHPSPADLVADLEMWTGAYFPGAERTHAWSAQDYKSANAIPFVGWLPRGAGKVFLATGFGKWGMTNGVAAGVRLSAEMLGGNVPWAKVLGRRVTRPQSMLAGAAANASVGARIATGWARGELTALQEPAEGQGVVGREGGRPVAACRIGGSIERVSAVCPHLGGIVNWNDLERSWDCPLHGSRFAADGTRLEGPATGDLARVDG